MKSFFSAVLVSAIAWSALAGAQADSYPARPVRIMIGASAGGGTDIIARVQLQRAIRLSDVDARLRGLGGEPGTLTTDQFAEMNRAEFERFGALIRKAGIKAGE